jgi:hypothetical protein
MQNHRFKRGNRAGKGRPRGSRNKHPQLLQDLMVLVMEIHGYPREIRVQATSPSGKRLFEMRDKVDAQGNAIRDKYGKIKRERCRDEDGKFIPIMIQERIWEGTDGVGGFLSFMLEHDTDEFLNLFCRVLRVYPWIRVPSESDQEEGPSIVDGGRAHLESWELPVDYFLNELIAGRLRGTNTPPVFQASPWGPIGKNYRRQKANSTIGKTSRWQALAIGKISEWKMVTNGKITDGAQKLQMVRTGQMGPTGPVNRAPVGEYRPDSGATPRIFSRYLVDREIC